MLATVAASVAPVFDAELRHFRASQQVLLLARLPVVVIYLLWEVTHHLPRSLLVIQWARHQDVLLTEACTCARCSVNIDTLTTCIGAVPVLAFTQYLQLAW